LNLILFFIAGLAVWLSGTRLTAYADIFVIGSTLSYAAQNSINLLQGVVLILLLSFILATLKWGLTQ